MDIIRAHRIELSPTQAQRVLFAKSCGTARKAWNWALDEWKKIHRENAGVPKEERQPISEAMLRKRLNAIKGEKFPWMAEVTKNAPQQAIKNLGMAWKRFFTGVSDKPARKRKGKHDSFRADHGTDKRHPDAVQVDGKRVKLPIIGWVRMKETIRFPGQIRSVTISRKADRWFASFTILTRDYVVPARDNQATGGVDLGIRVMAAVSDDSEYHSPKPLKRYLRKLRRLNKSLHRKKKGSRNRYKARMRLAALHMRIANIRKDCLHKTTTTIVKQFSLLGIEDLHVKGMQKQRSLARAVSDVGMGEFRRQVEYKSVLYGTDLVVASRWFASSKICNDCKCINRNLGREKTWTCDACGVIHDRDQNSSYNLEDYAIEARR